MFIEGTVCIIGYNLWLSVLFLLPRIQLKRNYAVFVYDECFLYYIFVFCYNWSNIICRTSGFCVIAL